VSVLSARAMLRLGEGKEGEAWQDLLACHRLARMSAHGFSLIELLVGIAVDAVVSAADLAYLEQAQLTSKQVRERLKDLQSLPPLPLPADNIDLGERYFCLDLLQSLQRNGFRAVPEEIELPRNLDPDTERKILEKIDWAPIYRSINQRYDRLTAAMRLTDRVELANQVEEIEKEIAALPKNGLKNLRQIVDDLDKAGADLNKGFSKALGDNMVRLLWPASRKTMSARDRAEQSRSNLYVAFALAAYRIDHMRYPKKLDDLAPKYLAAVPGDLFTGGPLTYRLEANGYLFYSFGINGKDDEGRWYNDEPQGDDIGVRMPLPPLKPRTGP
jgi:prepilin-type N-terminal cleavage/methylation domain-containing protein